ncbi:unnamed protein product [Acanthosepion pharaonis]|uniref:Uncharacterized protein n=1 Tax=Acanthosepion pharaonis TaxID=158019 RepID=A0A812BY04_ACAPH|nr:unnamed protein product [Sepia pharaonis]
MDMGRSEGKRDGGHGKAGPCLGQILTPSGRAHTSPITAFTFPPPPPSLILLLSPLPLSIPHNQKSPTAFTSSFFYSQTLSSSADISFSSSFLLTFNPFPYLFINLLFLVTLFIYAFLFSFKYISFLSFSPHFANTEFSLSLYHYPPLIFPSLSSTYSIFLFLLFTVIIKTIFSRNYCH